MPSILSKCFGRNKHTTSPPALASSSTTSLVSTTSSLDEVFAIRRPEHAAYFGALERSAVKKRDAKIGAGLAQMGW